MKKTMVVGITAILLGIVWSGFGADIFAGHFIFIGAGICVGAVLTGDYFNNKSNMNTKKLAIRMENKAEFEAVKNWYVSKGTRGNDFEYDARFPYITHHNGLLMFNSNHGLYNASEILSFSAFSQLTGEKAEVKPIVIEQNNFRFEVTSEGVEVFTLRNCQEVGAITNTASIKILPDVIKELYHALISLQP